MSATIIPFEQFQESRQRRLSERGPKAHRDAPQSEASTARPLVITSEPQAPEPQAPAPQSNDR